MNSTSPRSMYLRLALVLALLITPACEDARPASPDAAPAGEGPCTDSTACADGMLCANQLCKPSCPGPGGVGQTCAVVGSVCCGVGPTCVVGEGPLACTSACTPFDDGCPPGFGCHITNAQFDYSDCRPAGAGGQGASCATSADCAPGGFCLGGMTPMCVRHCVIDDADHGCGVGTRCQAWAFLDGVTYGACVPD